MNDEAILLLEQIEVGYGRVPVLRGLSLRIDRGDVVALVGANGSGKSTLVRAAAGLVRPSAGRVTVCGDDVGQLTRLELASRIAYLPQHPVAPGEMTVRHLVEQGRYPHLGPWSRFGADDRAAVSEALEVTAITELSGRRLETLSGGERQRAWCAVVIAQRAPVLLLDEPTTHLDVVHQLELLALVRRLNTEHHRTVIMVVHDLTTAVGHADRVVVLRHGAVIQDGTPDAVLGSGALDRAFDVDVTVLRDPRSGDRACLPRLRR